MFDKDKWQEIFAVLSKNKLRTFLTGFGVFWGIFMMIIMLGSGKGLENAMLSNFKNGATNSVFFWTQRTSKPYKGFKRGRRFNFENSDTKALKEQVPEIEILAPRNQLGGFRGNNNVVYKKEVGSFGVMGDYPEINQIKAIPMAEGRFLNHLDLEEKRKICVIGPKVQTDLFKNDEKPIGKYLQINGVYFKIIGVFKANSSGDRAERDNQTIYVPFTTFQQAFNYGNLVGWFAMTSKPEVPASILEQKVIQALAQRHSVHPEDDRAIGSWNTEEEYMKISGVFTGIANLSWFVGLLTLIAGVIGISNIMLVIVKERTREIGIRRAMGATPFNIIGQIIMEAIFLTIIAGYMGLVLGVFSLEGVSALVGNGDQFRQPGVSLAIAIKALIALIIAGTFAGLIPAQRAIRVSTVDALRAE